MKTPLMASTLAALLLMMAPAAAAEDHSEGGPFEPSMESMMSEVESFGQVVVSVQSDQIVFDWSGIVIGANMSTWIRHTFDDVFGDGDGYVSASEMEAGEDILRVFIKHELDSLATDTRASGYFVIDTNNPQSVEVGNVRTEGLVGPVNSTEQVRLDFAAAVNFATRSKDVHVVKLDIGQYYFRSVDESKLAQVVGDFTLTVRGDGGWSIDGDSLEPACAREAWDADSQSLVLNASHVNCFTGHNGLLLAFSISGGSGKFMGIPGFELPLVALGLLGAVALARRRR